MISYTQRPSRLPLISAIKGATFSLVAHGHNDGNGHRSLVEEGKSNRQLLDFN